MLAVKGYYDGSTVSVSGQIPMIGKSEVIITFLNADSDDAVSLMQQKEKRLAAFNRLVGLTKDNPVSLEEAREERLSKQ